MSNIIKSFLFALSILFASSLAFGEEVEVVKVDPDVSIQEEVNKVVVPKKKVTRRVKKIKPIKARKSYPRKRKAAVAKVVNDNNEATKSVEKNIDNQPTDSN